MLTGSALLALGVATVLPPLAHATGVPFFGPIVPTLNQTCAGNFNGLIQTVNNLLAFTVTMAIVFIAPLMIAYAGFLMVFEPASPGGHQKARKLLVNLVVGIVVALAAWLIVNMVLVSLTAKGIAQWTSGMFGGGTAVCLPVNVSETYTGTMGATTGSVVANLSPTGMGACDPTLVQQGAAAGGYSLSVAQSQTLACIAKFESGCGAANKNYAWGKGSSAAGAFQVLMQSNSSCYNNQACETAAGATGPLNCASGFSGGNPIPGSPVVAQCVQAAASISCSSSAAACLLANNGGSFSPWTADSHSANQAACIAQY